MLTSPGGRHRISRTFVTVAQLAASSGTMRNRADVKLDVSERIEMYFDRIRSHPSLRWLKAVRYRLALPKSLSTTAEQVSSQRPLR